MAMGTEKDSSNADTLVLGYLERVSSNIFENYGHQLTDLVGDRHGVYALYKGKRLYYVGLASNLRQRLRHHLRDKHAGKWDKFSMYLVRKADHIRELEAIIMRVASPAGNASRGKLGRAENLRRKLDRGIKERQDRERLDLLGSRRKRTKKAKVRKGRGKQVRTTSKPTLAPYVSKPFRIRGYYKGQKYVAQVNSGGSIRFDGQLYNSPSAAGFAARGRETNGWTFWRYRNESGEWVKLKELREV
jgi:hypothetical protein